MLSQKIHCATSFIELSDPLTASLKPLPSPKLSYKLEK